ncbi:MAG: lipoprotein, partial [Bacteroidaceae bacterium]|nr:lipoprotein [Bacteroidaceae bacterium]
MGKKTNGLILLLFAVAILTGCSGRRGIVTIR